MPGCPPQTARLVEVFTAIVTGAELPPPGSVIGAGDKAQCDECTRKKTENKGIKKFYRPWEVEDDGETCFLEQGYICLGPVTQAGCGTICPNKANAPCLGCFGAVVGIEDPGIKFISTLGSLSFDKDPDELMSFIRDPAGLFNRFTLAASSLGHKYHDKMEED